MSHRTRGCCHAAHTAELDTQTDAMNGGLTDSEDHEALKTSCHTMLELTSHPATGHVTSGLGAQPALVRLLDTLMTRPQTSP
ncbi:hypothetical protein BaRGS_00026236 [Batillaria attramentaria]|uniref:Uncharacterized protein n=1 Tax=Batillaria attramentaria TaxID=370345 RepID=A0ABD0K539_9CAEN